MELYLLRHAHAGDPAKWTGDDARRPLTAKGRGQAERLGRLLAGLGLRPDAIVSSPLARADETAAIVADALGVTVATDDRLAPGFDGLALDGLIHDLGRPVRLVVVGHDPDLSELLAELVGTRAASLRKGALARVDLEPDDPEGTAVLRWLVPPDLLEGD